MGYYAGPTPDIIKSSEVEKLLKTNTFVGLDDYTRTCECGYGFMVKEFCDNGNRFYCIGCDKNYFEERNEDKKPHKLLPEGVGSDGNLWDGPRLTIGPNGSEVKGCSNNYSMYSPYINKGLAEQVLEKHNLSTTNEKEMKRIISKFPGEIQKEFNILKIQYEMGDIVALDTALTLYKDWSEKIEIDGYIKEGNYYKRRRDIDNF